MSERADDFEPELDGGEPFEDIADDVADEAEDGEDGDAGLEYDPEDPIVKEAIAEGWKPPDQWKGERPKNGLKGPEEYLNSYAVVKKREQRAIENTKRLERKLDEVAANSTRLVGEATKQRVEAWSERYHEIGRSYDAAIEEAFDYGDKARMRQLMQDKQRALAEHAGRAPQQQPTEQPRAQPQGPDPEVQAKVGEMFAEAPQLNTAAGKAMMNSIAGDMLSDPVWQNADRDAAAAEMMRRVREYMPQWFKKDGQQARPNPVENGAPRSAGKRSKGAADLPPTARAQAKEDIENGLFKNIDEYAAEYWKYAS